MIKDIFKELEDTLSRLEKEKILEANKMVMKDLVWWAVEPTKIFFVKQIPEITFGKKTIEEIEEEFLTLLTDLAYRKITGHAALDKIEEVIDGLTKEDYDIACRILTKDLKCGIQSATLLKIYGEGFLSNFTVQLANKYSATKKYKDVDYFYANKKLDGLRGYYTNGVLCTRNGKFIEGFESIISEQNYLAKKYKLSFMDGELFSRDIPFQTIQGYVMRRKDARVEDKEKIQFWCFAVGNDGKEFTTEEMVEKIDEIICAEKDLKYIKMMIKNDSKLIYSLVEKAMAEGYEGIMLRHPKTSYDRKRSDALLKVKLFNESDFTIVDFVEGEGKYVGMLGKILVEGVVGKFKISSGVGSGFSDEQRTEIWNNKKKYFGMKVEVKYQNLTDDFSSLRFPIFLKTKEDR
jgi:DNA ligase-1